MTAAWTPIDTTTHQDHVIAHVVGATVRGYFVYDEALYILLDIGFIWSILLDGEMGLLPHPVAISELEIDDAVRSQLKADVEILLRTNSENDQLSQFRFPPANCQIENVSLFAADDGRRFLIQGEEESLAVETSLTTGEIQIMNVEDKEPHEGESKTSEDKLQDVAESEHDYLHQRLREELGREPTEAELDEWLRQHTEGY